ncbi:MAG: hypothetical protein ABL951_15770 [Alphaproteobacteria bacterium]
MVMNFHRLGLGRAIQAPRGLPRHSPFKQLLRRLKAAFARMLKGEIV